MLPYTNNDLKKHSKHGIQNLNHNPSVQFSNIRTGRIFAVYILGLGFLEVEPNPN